MFRSRNAIRQIPSSPKKMRPSAFIFFISLSVVRVAAADAVDPFARDTGTILRADISRLACGDTARIVIEKFGSPAPVDVVVPFLVYELREDTKKHFVFYFTPGTDRKLSEDSVLRAVEFVEGDKRGRVWPASAKGKPTNQSPILR